MRSSIRPRVPVPLVTVRAQSAGAQVCGILVAIMGTASGIGEPLGADSAGVPTDPLHERIASYELHGYPERSRYLERRTTAPSCSSR